ncbi:hypothetical protein DY000_02034623 [Brassica cretica]|uniref:Uncharacterized protein n=1 Tax=Brassica cretica TaxID=69181 RepID=A0ABQ7DT96_BRACR|nr:hypothetical protein DY000_02034623 [Brassica cretica]
MSLLDNLLAKREPLSESEEALKRKLIEDVLIEFSSCFMFWCVESVSVISLGLEESRVWSSLLYLSAVCCITRVNHGNGLVYLSQELFF